MGGGGGPPRSGGGGGRGGAWVRRGRRMQASAVGKKGAADIAPCLQPRGQGAVCSCAARRAGAPHLQARHVATLHLELPGQLAQLLLRLGPRRLQLLRPALQLPQPPALRLQLLSGLRVAGVGAGALRRLLLRALLHTGGQGGVDSVNAVGKHKAPTAHLAVWQTACCCCCWWWCRWCHQHLHTAAPAAASLQRSLVSSALVLQMH